MPQILDKHPDVVFLQISKNDVSNGLCGAKAAGKIVDVVKYLLGGEVSRLVVGQLLSFPKLRGLGKCDEIISANWDKT